MNWFFQQKKKKKIYHLSIHLIISLIVYQLNETTFKRKKLLLFLVKIKHKRLFFSRVESRFQYTWISATHWILIYRDRECIMHFKTATTTTVSTVHLFLMNTYKFMLYVHMVRQKRKIKMQIFNEADKETISKTTKKKTTW